jgi:hypothetical protein
LRRAKKVDQGKNGGVSVSDKREKGGWKEKAGGKESEEASSSRLTDPLATSKRAAYLFVWRINEIFIRFLFDFH